MFRLFCYAFFFLVQIYLRLMSSIVFKRIALAGFHNVTTGILRQVSKDLNSQKSYNDKNVFLPIITFVIILFLQDLYKFESIGVMVIITTLLNMVSNKPSYNITLYFSYIFSLYWHI
jgi:hypothetical protein